MIKHTLKRKPPMKPVKNAVKLMSIHPLFDEVVLQLYESSIC